MKQQGFTMKVEGLDRRTPHRKALFDRNLPYGHKVEKCRKAYVRKPKHSKGNYDAS